MQRRRPIVTRNEPQVATCRIEALGVIPQRDEDLLTDVGRSRQADQPDRHPVHDRAELVVHRRHRRVVTGDDPLDERHLPRVSDDCHRARA